MKTFGWTRPVRDPDGSVVGSKPSPVKVRTLNPLGHAFGGDHDKRLVVTAHPMDLIGIRPERTARELTIAARDLYRYLRYLLQCAANMANLERARARKAAKAERLARERNRRAEKRLTRNL